MTWVLWLSRFRAAVSGSDRECGKPFADKYLRLSGLNVWHVVVIVEEGLHGGETEPEALQEDLISVLILLTNDDGIYAPGLAALERELRSLGEVYVVAPATEQSGVGHSITYLTPLIVKEVFYGDEHWGWAVEGSPADCVKIGVTEFCPRRPDLVVSGINGGLNAGINVLYSGTVAAAIEGAFFGITSVAVSLQFDEHAQFDKAARLARTIIQQVLEKKGPEPQLYNMNVPTAALDGTPQVRVVPMDVSQYGEQYEKRTDPFGRVYYWLTGQPPPPGSGHETDLSVLAEGNVALTPLGYDMTRQEVVDRMQPWEFRLDGVDSPNDPTDNHGARRPPVSTARERQPMPSPPAQ